MDEESPREGTVLSFRWAMLAFLAIAGFCFFTLRGEPLFIALLIVGALALKTWLARVRRRLDEDGE